MARVLVDVICEVLKESHGFTKKILEGDVKKKMNMSIRCSFAEMYLNVLLKFGQYPDASQQPLVNYFIDSLLGLETPIILGLKQLKKRSLNVGLMG